METNYCVRCENEVRKDYLNTGMAHTCGKETNKEDWQHKFLKAGTENGCGDLSIMIGTVSEILSTQEEEILKQLETIDIKMGDPDAEAKVKFAIKAMIRHIKLKNATK